MNNAFGIRVACAFKRVNFSVFFDSEIFYKVRGERSGDGVSYRAIYFIEFPII